jgi:hypothetical protein
MNWAPDVAAATASASRRSSIVSSKKSAMGYQDADLLCHPGW